MIVLGPNVLAHCNFQEDDSSNGDFIQSDEAIAKSDDDSSGNDKVHLSSVANTECPAENDFDSLNNSYYSKQRPLGACSTTSEENLRLYHETRLKVTRALGSIGASPLTHPHTSMSWYAAKSESCCTIEEEIFESINPNPMAAASELNYSPTNSKEQDDEFKFYLHLINKMANDHTQLLQAMAGALNILSVGTGLQLGLGASSANGSLGAGLGSGSVVGGTFGSSRLVSRAEKAWVARRIRQSQESTSNDKNAVNGDCDSKNENISSSGDGFDESKRNACRPKLTLHRSRHILHQTIVDQATSLKSVCQEWASLQYSSTVPNKNPNNDSDTIKSVDSSTLQSNNWNEFVKDLHYSLNQLQKAESPLLTLSQLTQWVSSMGEFLSFVLSTLLSSDLLSIPFVHSRWNVLLRSLSQTSTMAEERFVFLHSVFPLSGCSTSIPSTASSSSDNTGSIGRGGLGSWRSNNEFENSQTATRRDLHLKNKKWRETQKMIESLNSALEAARISLWAFQDTYATEQSECRENDNGNSMINEEGRYSTNDTYDCERGGSDDPIIWWSHIKEMLLQTCNAAADIEEIFLEKEIKPMEESEKDGSDVEPMVTAKIYQCPEYLSSNPVSSGDKLPGEGLGEFFDEAHAGKVLVFAGSGKFKKSQQSSRKVSTTTRSDHNGVSRLPLYDSSHQITLMQDLQNRLKSLGIVEEHEVVVKDVIEKEVQDSADSAKDMGDTATAKGNRGNSPFFLGVTGSILDELSSAMAAVSSDNMDLVEHHDSV